MKVKTIVIPGLKVVALTILLFISFTIGAMAAGLGGSAETGTTTEAMGAMLLMCFLDASVLSYPIIRSRWTGWRLVLTTFFVFYGVKTFLSQIETVVFLQYLSDIVPTEMVPQLFIQGAITAAIFSPLAVLILGRMRGKEEAPEPNQRLVMPWTEWLWKLLAIAVIYVVIYISFGAFVFTPLAGEAFQEYYGNLQMPGWILPFQMLRGLIWAGLALPVIRMMKGRWWEAGLAVALLFSVLMASSLLVPNELMPKAIRMAHFVEVSSSNFLFGWIVVWLLNRHHSSLRELFQ